MTAGTVWSSVCRLLIFTGLTLMLLGVALHLLGRHVGHWRGLPGDVELRVGGLTLYVPLATGIVVSIVLSLLLTGGSYLASLLRR